MYCKKAKEKGADIVLFPEMWSNGYNIYDRPVDEWKKDAISIDSNFINTFGNISKRLEKRGSFFHRSALQALDGGPILALNLKPFADENFGYDKFNPINVNPTAITEGKGLLLNNGVSKSEIAVNTLYDTNRFWKLDADQLPSKITAGGDTFIYLTATGPKSKSCTVLMRKYTPAN